VSFAGLGSGLRGPMCLPRLGLGGLLGHDCRVVELHGGLVQKLRVNGERGKSRRKTQVKILTLVFGVPAVVAEIEFVHVQV
jgi:hypothetical protein